MSYFKYQENTLREIRNGGIGKSVQLKDVVSYHSKTGNMSAIYVYAETITMFYLNLREA